MKLPNGTLQREKGVYDATDGDFWREAQVRLQSKCCGDLDSSGTCPAPACRQGDALKAMSEMLDHISQTEVRLKNQAAQITGRHQYVGQDYQFRITALESQLADAAQKRVRVEETYQAQVTALETELDAALVGEADAQRHWEAARLDGVEAHEKLDELRGLVHVRPDLWTAMLRVCNAANQFPDDLPAALVEWRVQLNVSQFIVR